MLFFLLFQKIRKNTKEMLYSDAGLSPYRQFSTVAMILEFDSCHLDFDDKMSNYKTDQSLVHCMSNSWSFFRARVDQLHMSYNAL
jgi:hypothetical protein